MRNVLAEQVGCNEVIDVSGLSGMWPERERVHAARLPELVEGVQVRVDVVRIVAAKSHVEDDHRYGWLK